MEKQVIVGVDVGGTAIKMALLSLEGEILSKREEPTPVAEGEDGVIGKIAEMIKYILEEQHIAKERLAGIGLGIPGPVDAATGTVRLAVNLGGWKNTPLKAKLEALVGRPVEVENDANVAALGEMWRGAGQGADDMILVTLGTGVGGGVIIGGKIVRGINGVSGEIGHLTMTPSSGPLCNCGKMGCLETYASATAVIREGTQLAQTGKSTKLADILAKEGKLRAKDIYDVAMAGDEAALAIIDQQAYYLGLAFSHLANLLDPQKIVIGGGVSAAGDFLFSRIRKEFAQFLAFPFVAESCQIIQARLGNDAGVIGAAWLVREKLE